MTGDLFAPRPGPPLVLIDGPDVITEGTAESWATFSRCRKFRYVLGRMWDAKLVWWLSVTMLNPSKADHLRSDPTVTRMIGFAKRDGFGGLIVTNGFGLRATDPRELLTAADPVGPRNLDAIHAVAHNPAVNAAIVAWGAAARKDLVAHLHIVHDVITTIRPVYCLGAPTKAGHPRHPLYLRADTPMIRYGGMP